MNDSISMKDDDYDLSKLCRMIPAHVCIGLL